MITQKIVLLLASILGGISVVLGAFGGHALKKILEVSALKSFETGVKYQMYHALVLLFVGGYFKMQTLLEKSMVGCFALGVFLFSFSIYGLVLSGALGKKLSFLGPVTPLGGLLLITGWFLLALCILKNFKQ